MKLEGKVAIVTGSSRGIGKEIALAFAREGADVVVVARKRRETGLGAQLPGSVHETADEIRALGRRALPVETDVTKWEDVEEMGRKTLQEFGEVDILVNDAAVAVPGLLRNVEIRYFDLPFRVKVRGAFFCVRAVLESMIERKSGNIINIYGSWGKSRLSGHAPYGIGQAAMERFTWALADELREFNIAVNALHPDITIGSIRTPGMDWRESVAGGEGEYSEWVAAQYEMGLRSPELMGRAAVLLAMEDAKSFTGNIITDIDVHRRWLQAHQKPMIPGKPVITPYLFEPYQSEEESS